jgi:diadenosine tetraphosphate (Ap4A) HIT family hydrolase
MEEEDPTTPESSVKDGKREKEEPAEIGESIQPSRGTISTNEEGSPYTNYVALESLAVGNSTSKEEFDPWVGDSTDYEKINHRSSPKRVTFRDPYRTNEESAPTSQKQQSLRRNDCPLCKIIPNVDPNTILHRDDRVITFLHPQQENVGRTWVVPISHIGPISLRSDENQIYFNACQRTIRKLQDTVVLAYDPSTIDVHQLSCNCGFEKPNDANRHVYFDFVPRYTYPVRIQDQIELMDTRKPKLIQPFDNLPFEKTSGTTCLIADNLRAFFDLIRGEQNYRSLYKHLD